MLGNDNLYHMDGGFREAKLKAVKRSSFLQSAQLGRKSLDERGADGVKRSLRADGDGVTVVSDEIMEISF